MVTTTSRTPPVLDAGTYDEFRLRLRTSNCPLCPALCKARKNIVVDRGNPEAQIVLIGEAPGEKEDQQGQAFVGRSGKLLDSVFATSGLDTNRDTLILNVVKCRPPGNRPPTREEAAHCRPYLKWQLDHVKPRIIVLLGATAAGYFSFGGQNLKSRVGTSFTSPEVPAAVFFQLYHPAYVLRDPRKRPEMEAHVRALKKCIDELEVR